MLLSISTTHTPATDLGYLLHKNPSRLHSTELGFGEAHVFYPEATQARCTACLLVDLDPLKLRAWQRGRGAYGEGLFDYVNDRPYVASSFMTVALGKVFSSALGGRSRERPELAEARLPLTATIHAARCRGGESIARRVFEPLGYQVTIESHVPDGTLDIEPGNVFTLTLNGDKTVRELLTHLYVLIPVLDDQKHYAVGEDEVEKLLRRGEDWLAQHPSRDLIIARYLRHRRRLTSQAIARLLEPAEEEAEAESDEREASEDVLEKPIALGVRRMDAVVSALKDARASSVLDLGCGEGQLLGRLLEDPSFDRIVGVDVSIYVLERAKKRLRLDRRPEQQVKRLELLLGSLTFKDRRLSGFDAAAIVEVIEHLEPDAVARFSQAIFGEAKPRAVIVTTPNSEYNLRFENLKPGTMRHPDHRFEWTRGQFAEWASGVARRFGYAVELLSIGEEDIDLGSPTQMAVFRS